METVEISGPPASPTFWPPACTRAGRLTVVRRRSGRQQIVVDPRTPCLANGLCLDRIVAGIVRAGALCLVTAVHLAPTTAAVLILLLMVAGVAVRYEEVAIARPSRIPPFTGDGLGGVTADISAGDAGLMLIDPTTGNRTILSDNTNGTGMPFDQPIGVSVLPSGQLLVVDDGVSSGEAATPTRLYLVDPTTGNRTVISQNTITNSQNPPYMYPEIGSGPQFGPYSAGARQVGNQILLTATASSLIGQLMAVDPSTGDRSVISNSSMGTGPGLIEPEGFVVSGNTAFVAQGAGGLMTVDLSTGNRTLFSGGGAGTGPALSGEADLEPYDGQLYVSGYGSFTVPATYGVYRIDPTTGNRTVVENGTVGSGPTGNAAKGGLAIEPGGTILLTVGPDAANNFNGLLAVDPTTGNRTFLSDATHGTGPTFNEFISVAVVPLAGDANGDGIVNAQDLATISSQWNQSGLFLTGDLNNDGIVNAQDLALISSNWLGSSLGHGGAVPNNIAAVPEPTGIVIFAVGILLLRVGRSLRKH